MHSNGLIDWTCSTCGKEFKNVIPPVHHTCRSRGFGDTVAKITSAVGVKPCGKCKKRQEKLNKLLPYKEK